MHYGENERIHYFVTLKQPKGQSFGHSPLDSCLVIFFKYLNRNLRDGL